MTPSLTDIPAPSIVTTVAPLAPARAPFGPIDFPPTTIPSVVPTPNVPAPSAPQTLHSSTRPLGLADVPQPGASLAAPHHRFPANSITASRRAALPRNSRSPATTPAFARQATIIFCRRRGRPDPPRRCDMKRARRRPARATAIPTRFRRSRQAAACAATKLSRVTRKAARRKAPIRCIRANSPQRSAAVADYAHSARQSPDASRPNRDAARRRS